MVVLKVKEITKNQLTNEDGEILRKEILKALSEGNPVTVSFLGISGLNTSFINSAFIDLLDFYDFDFIKENLKFVDSTKGINEAIQSRFAFELSNNNG